MSADGFDPSELKPVDDGSIDVASLAPYKPRSALGEIANQGKAGLLSDLPEVVGQGAQFANRIVGGGEDNLVGRVGRRIAQFGEEQGQRPDLQPHPEEHNAITNALAGGARMIPQSVVPPVAAGLALASLPVELPAAAVTAGAIGLGVLPGAFSQGEQTYEAGKKAKLSDEAAMSAARKTAAIEGGGEVVQDVLGGRVLGAIGKAGARTLTRGAVGAGEEALTNAVKPGVVKPFLKSAGEAAVGEPLTEFAQQAGEASVEQAAGIPQDKSPVQQGLEVVPPTLGMTAIMAALGLPLHGMRARAVEKQGEKLASGDTTPEQRMAIARDIHDQIKEADPVAAKNFADNVTRAVFNKNNLPLDAALLQPPANLPALPAPTAPATETPTTTGVAAMSNEEFTNRMLATAPVEPRDAASKLQMAQDLTRLAGLAQNDQDRDNLTFRAQAIIKHVEAAIAVRGPAFGLQVEAAKTDAGPLSKAAGNNINATALAALPSPEHARTTTREVVGEAPVDDVTQPEPHAGPIVGEPQQLAAPEHFVNPKTDQPFQSMPAANAFLKQFPASDRLEAVKIGPRQFAVRVKPAQEQAPVSSATQQTPATSAPATAQNQNTTLPAQPEWNTFPKTSGTLGIPRAEMPQIKAEHRGALVNFLNARGVTHESEEVPASSLKPTQAEFSPAKVEQAKSFSDTDRSILVSSDNHVLDGHHQWLAKAQSGEPIKIIRLNAPIKQLLPLAHEFPSSTTAPTEKSNAVPVQGADARSIQRGTRPQDEEGGTAVGGGNAESQGAPQLQKAAGEGGKGQETQGAARGTGPADRADVAPYFDKRLENETTRAHLEHLSREAGWATIGGRILRASDGTEGDRMRGGRNTGEVTGRSPWVPNAPWFQREQQVAPLQGNTSGKETMRVVGKALKREPMGAAQRRHVQAMLDELDALKAEAEEYAQRELDEVLLSEKMAETEDTNPAQAGLTIRAMEVLGEDAVERLAAQHEKDEDYVHAVEAAIAAKETADRAATVRRNSEGVPQGGAREESQPAAESPKLELTPQTETSRRAEEEQRAAAEAEQARKNEEAHQRAEADRARESFALTGSNRDADVAASKGQESLFGGEKAVHEGRWTIRDKRDTDFMGRARQVGETFATKEDAEAFLPMAAVGLKHRIRLGDGGKYEIWRNISDRKSVKVVDKTFDSREAAMEYMARHAAEILETNTTFGEADLPQSPDRKRTGAERRKGDVKGKDFMDAFGLRAVEFGNWNNQTERQALMNDAYDGLMDLADVLGVPPKALGLNGDLALAFGARGHGLSSARAHYELDRAVINLTKENGAGSLAHEWFHAFDAYLGRQDGKASSEWKVAADGTRTLKAGGPEVNATHGFRIRDSGVREEVRKAYEALVNAIFKKASVYVEDASKADDFAGRARTDLEAELGKLRKELSEQKDPAYWKRNNKPASAELLAEFDTIAKRMLDGEAQSLATDWRQIATSKAKIAARWTNDSLERLGAIFKEVRGRSGFGESGWMDRLRGYMNRYSQRLKMLADAQSGTEKTRMTPTEFAMNAKELDQGRGGEYWTTPHEMAARAFQGYVEDKIAGGGNVSRFLNYAPENGGILTPWGVKFPYPRGAERKAINSAIDSFVKTLKSKDTDKGTALFSKYSLAQDGKPNGISTEEAQRAVDDFKREFGAKGGLDKIVFDVRPDAVSAFGDRGRDLQAKGGFLPKQGRVVLVAANLGSYKDAITTLRHEVLAHYGLNLFAPAQKLGILSRIIETRDNPLFKALWADVDRLYPKEDEFVRAEELFARVAQDTPSRLRAWFDKLLTWIGSQLRSIGFIKGIASPADLREFARSIGEGIKRGVEQRNFPANDHVQFSLTRSTDDELTALFKSFANHDTAFQQPTPKGTTLDVIAGEIDPEFKVEEQSENFAQFKNADKAWRVNIGKGPRAAMVFQRGRTVWLDVSRLLQGQDRGTRLYNIAAAYAHNTGRTLIGDPDGLSKIAYARRTDNMLSSALKFGTTDHLEPHEAQTHPERYFSDDRAFVDTTRPIDWKAGEFEHNLRELLLTAYHNEVQRHPEIKNVVYNFENRRFETVSGRQRDPFAFLGVQPSPGNAGSTGGARPGEATAKRAALVNTLVRGTSREGWRAILGQLGRQLSGDGLDRDLHDIFYRQGEEAGTEADRANADAGRDGRTAAVGERSDRLRAKGIGGEPASEVKETPPSAGSSASGDEEIKFRVESTPENDVLAKIGLAIDTRSTAQKIRDAASSTFEQAKSTWGDTFRTAALDRFHPLRKAEGNIAAEASAYIAARMSTSAGGATNAAMLFGVPEWRDGILQKKAGSKGLLDVLSPVKQDLNGFIGWMVGKRAQYLATQGRERLLSAADIEKLTNVGQDKAQLYAGVATNLRNFNTGILEMLRDAGLLSAPQVGAFAQDKYYVPFYRTKEGDDVTAPWTRRGLAGQSAPTKELKGGTSKLNDPLQNMLVNLHTAIDAAMKNEAMRRAARNLELPEVPEGQRGEKDVLTYRNFGEKKYVKVEDPALLGALSQINAMPPVGVLRKFARATKRLLTESVTLDPAFMVANFIRDTMQTWLINKDGMKFATASITGLKDALKGIRNHKEIDEDLQNLMFSGASFMGGHAIGSEPEAEAAKIRARFKAKGFSDDYVKSLVLSGKQLLHLYTELGSRVENSNRLAAYRAALGAGKSKAEAAFESKDLMDYSLRGGHYVTGVLIDMLPFFNARVQGLDKLYREGKVNGRQILYRGALTMTLASIALMAANGDDPDYDALSDYEKDTYWHIFAAGTHWRIPKPFELGILFGTLPERVMRSALGQDTMRDSARSFAFNVGQVLAFNPIPQALLPGVEAYFNKSFFTGAPIENESDQNKLPEARYNARTSRLAVGLGDLTGTSPKMLEHLMAGYGGTLATYSMSAADMLYNEMSGRVAPAPQIGDIPVIGRFLKIGTPHSVRYGNDLYDVYQQAEQVYSTIREYRKEGRKEEASALLESNRPLLGVRNAIGVTKNTLSKLRSQIQQVSDDKKLSASDKRDRIDELQGRINSLEKRAYDLTRSAGLT